MFPYIYPPDAQTFHFATNTPDISEVLIEVPDGETYTILGISSVSRVAAALNGTLECGSQDLLSFSRGAVSNFELLTAKCIDDVTITISAGTPIAGFQYSGNIVYVGYDIATGGMSTSTKPYTEYCDYSGSSVFCYNSKDTSFQYATEFFIIATIAFLLAYILKRNR